MEDRPVERWAASGAMALTGPRHLALGPPAGLIDGIDRMGESFPGLDLLALLGERAALMGLLRRGATSCGGSCRLFRASHGWVAVSLPREEDRDLVPAWLSLDEPPVTEPATWSAIERALASGDGTALVERSHLLGLPVARVGDVTPPAVRAIALGDAGAKRVGPDLVVLDLSALWAGPLCGDLLAQAGASVIKVESTTRPDGARRGPEAFFDLLNARKRSIALDFAHTEDRALLRRLVASVDVVIEASRPRALEQLGISASEVVRSGGPRVWVSITGHGRSGEGALRVAFGDDAAASGGLVVWRDDEPSFCADAVADPLTGITAAHECLGRLAEGGRWLLDIAMTGVAAAHAGPTLAAPPDLDVAEPRAREAVRSAPRMGADTAQVLSELGVTD